VGRRRASRSVGLVVVIATVALASLACAWAQVGGGAAGPPPPATQPPTGAFAIAVVSDAARERHAREQDAVLARAAELALRIEPAGIGFMRPVAGPISSPYGWRDLWVSGSRFHGGIDIAADMGTPVVASRGGRVSFAGWSGVYGYVVFIDHEEGWQTRYAHLSRIDVRLGEALRQGAPVGAIGSTGLSTGPHLHFEVRYEGRALDPLTFVPR
jgi:murein DD-endopeptidase MepM/ murein hydrolase activator NlpD